MDPLQTLDYALGQLRHVVAGIDDSEMDAPTNCEPWTVRRLASHALNNQLLWGGLVNGLQLATVEDTMGAVPIAGDLAPVADDVTTRALALWSTDGILDAIHATPLGELPGAVVANFAIVDAVAHAWDLSASLGRAIEFDSAALPAIAAVVAATCTDGARDHGLIKAPADVPPDATETERLMAAAGRAIRR
jgi:uncharacterized protein (TIGR03086 family)